ncbi:MAG: ABC transporter substrate-binding protein [Clostridiaceae bacterium]
MKKSKRIIATLLSLAMVIMMVGCGSNGNDKYEQSDKEEITIWAWDPAYNIVALNEAKAIYKKENPDVTINVVEMAKADIEQKLNAVLVSGKKKGLPDAVLVEDLNAQKYLSAYPGAFVPYDNVDFSQFATPVDFMTIDGETYGVPFGLATTGIYYRIDYLEQAGYTEEDMQNITWDKYIEIGKKVKEATGKDMLTFDPNDSSFIRIMLQSAGSWYTDKDGNADIKNNEYLKEAFKTVKKMQEADITKVVTGWSEFVSGFNSGDVASVITGCWITPSVMAEQSQSGNWRIAPTPRMDIEGSVNASNLGGSSWYILNGTPGQEIAKDFIADTFAGSKELYENILTNNGISSMYSPAFDSSAYQESQEFFGGQKTNSDLGEWTKNVQAVNFGEYTWEADAIISSAMVQVLDGESIDPVLEDAEEQFNTQIQ